jgi:hypothetical protein
MLAKQFELTVYREVSTEDKEQCKALWVRAYKTSVDELVVRARLKALIDRVGITSDSDSP